MDVKQIGKAIVIAATALSIAASVLTINDHAEQVEQFLHQFINITHGSNAAPMEYIQPVKEIRAEVDARLGWQDVDRDFHPGDSITITSVSGRWTCNKNGQQLVGPEGDQILSDKKYTDSAPLCSLLIRLPDGTVEIAPLDKDIALPKAGRIAFRPNDADGQCTVAGEAFACLSDNLGSLYLQIKLVSSAQQE